MEHLKTQFTDYLARLIRETQKDCLKLGMSYKDFNTDNWIIVVPTCSELACYDTLLGFPVYTCNYFPEDFKIAIPSAQEQDRKILKVFNELKELLPIGANKCLTN